MKPYEKEDQKIRITTLKVEYKVIPFSDTLWKTVLKKVARYSQNRRSSTNSRRTATQRHV